MSGRPRASSLATAAAGAAGYREVVASGSIASGLYHAAEGGPALDAGASGFSRPAVTLSTLLSQALLCLADFSPVRNDFAVVAPAAGAVERVFHADAKPAKQGLDRRGRVSVGPSDYALIRAGRPTTLAVAPRLQAADRGRTPTATAPPRTSMRPCRLARPDRANDRTRSAQLHRRPAIARTRDAVQRRHAPDDRRADRPRGDAHGIAHSLFIAITRHDHGPINTAVKSTQTETAKGGKVLLTPWMR